MTWVDVWRQQQQREHLGPEILIVGVMELPELRVGWRPRWLPLSLDEKHFWSCFTSIPGISQTRKHLQPGAAEPSLLQPCTV